MPSFLKHAPKIAAAASLLVFVQIVSGHEIVYPEGSNVVNVVTDYGADPTGNTDATQALNDAINENPGWNVIYLPKGIYKVTGPVFRSGVKASDETVGPVIQGESRTGTVIRLEDGKWPTDNLNVGGSTSSVDRSKVVLYLGDGGNKTYRRGISNLTINIGRNNDGAVGIEWMGSNSGLLSDVTIKSEDTKGCIGLALTGSENGPTTIRNVTIDGFKRGILANPKLGATLYSIRLENQTVGGLYNNRYCWVDSLAFDGTGRAVTNWGNGFLTLVNGYFKGSGTTAVSNSGKIFLRNIKTSGYSEAMSGTGSANISEYTNGKKATGLFNNASSTMNLPIKYPPISYEQDASKWLAIESNRGGFIGPQQTDSGVVAIAFADQTKNSLVLSKSSYSFTQDISIPAHVTNLIGMDTKITSGKIVVEEGGAPLHIERFEFNDETGVTVKGNRTVIIESTKGGVITLEGTGDVFVNDRLGYMVVNNAAQRVWARGYNLEFCGIYHDPGNIWSCTDPSFDLLRITAGRVWMMGYKSEGHLSKLHLDNGQFELLGFLQYTPSQKDFDFPMFVVGNDGQFCVAMANQRVLNVPTYTDLIKETKNNTTKTLTTTDNPDNQNLSLYTGYDTSKVPTSRKLRRVNTGSLHATVLPGNLIHVQGAAAGQVRLIDVSGRIVYRHAIEEGACIIDASHISSGKYFVETSQGATKSHVPLILLNN